MKDLTTGNELKVIIHYSIPMLLGNFFQQLYNIVDAIIVGNLIGKEALSAVGNSFYLIFLLDSLLIGFTIGGTIIISQFFGARKYEKVQEVFETIYGILFITSFIIATVTIITSKFIFQALNLPKEIIPLAVDYLNIYVIGYPFAFLFFGISASLRGLGDSVSPLYFTIISEILNIIGDIVLIKYFKLGVAGAAWATSFSYFAALAFQIYYLNKKNWIIKFNFRVKISREQIKKIFQISTPSSIQMFLLSLSNIAVIAVLNKFGTDIIATFSIAFRVSSLATMPSIFFANALTGFVGQNFGAKKIERISNGLLQTLKVNVILTFFLSILLIAFSEKITGLFTKDSKVIEICSAYLRFASPWIIFFTISSLLSGYFRGLGLTHIPMYTSIITSWLVRFPAIVLFSGTLMLIPPFFIPKNYKGLFWGEPLGWIAGFIFTIIYYLATKNKVKKASYEAL